MSQTDNFPYKEQLMDIVHDMGSQMYIPQLVQHFDKSMIFDTTEKVVGKWIDGRPIYQKTISVGTLPNNTEKSVSHGISNLNRILHIHGCAYRDNNKRNIELPFVGLNNGVTTAIQVDATESSGLRLYSNSDFSAFTESYVTLLYTKTTDAAGSYNIADENDYSTTEKIVGTWIDGKPVYQKTVDIGALPNAGTKQVAHNISNFGTLIKIFGAMKGSNQAPLPFVMGASASSITLNDLNYQVMVAVNTTNIDVAVHQNLSSFNGYITLQYTKTTD